MDTICLSPALLTDQCNFLDFTWDVLVPSKHQIGSCISQVLCTGGWFAGTRYLWCAALDGNVIPPFSPPIYAGPSEHNRIISGLKKWVSVCCQPCGEACAGAVLVLQRHAWHQNLVH